MRVRLSNRELRPTLGPSRVASRRRAARFIGPEVDSKPGSVPAPGCPDAGEDHSSRRRIAAPLERSHPDAGPVATNRSGTRASRPRRRPYSSLLREGLASPPVTRLSRVGSYPTISPLPVPPPRSSHRGPRPHRPSAVSFLLRFPSGRPGSPLATSLLCGARTFLPRNGVCPPAIPRPPPVGRQLSSGAPLAAAPPCHPSPVSNRYLRRGPQGTHHCRSTIRARFRARARSSTRWPVRSTGSATAGRWC